MHQQTVSSIESVQEASKIPRTPRAGALPKTDVRYWQGVLFQPAYTKDGEKRQVPAWAVKIQHRGRRMTFSLGTPNKTAAAAKARDIYLSLQAGGWEDTLSKFKPGMIGNPVGAGALTVGEFIAEVQARGSAQPRTLEGYAVAFRKIVADLEGIDGGRAKYDHRTGGREKWLQRINAVVLGTITPERVQEWKLLFIRRAGESATRRRQARNSANTFLRNARSLFSPKLLKFVRLNLPEPLPFAGVQFEARSSSRYRSEIDASAMVRAAREELESKYPEQFQIFLLAIMAGLRRREIDLLEWSALDFERGLIRVQATAHFQPKSEDSLGDVEIDQEVVEVFRRYHSKAKGPFVIHSKNRPRANPASHYRCQKNFEGLTAWLRSKGIRAKTPLHSLRKEFGSLLCERGGIYEASRALRHADIHITTQHYIDRKRRVTVGLGGFLKE